MSIKYIVIKQYQEMIDAATKHVSKFKMPPEGWLRTNRKALQMPAKVIMDNAGIKSSELYRIEKAEVEGTLTLNKLRDTANAMGCEFHYAIVPKDEIKNLIENKARRHAITILRNASVQMQLEEQGTTTEQIESQVDSLTEKLIKAGISAAAIHGNKSQGARTKALRNFKDNTIKILVATDIAARGLDIPLLPHVINFELPNVPEDYVHRIGRTGRAGAAGEAISLVCSEEVEYQNEIEKLLKEKLNSTIVEGFEPTDTAPTKRAATQSKGSFGKKKSGAGGNRPKNKPHFKGNKNTPTSGRGRTGAPKRKRT